MPIMVFKDPITQNVSMASMEIEGVSEKSRRHLGRFILRTMADKKLRVGSIAGCRGDLFTACVMRIKKDYYEVCFHNKQEEKECPQVPLLPSPTDNR
jgi:hypothetical protein